MNCPDAVRLMSEKRDRRLSWRARVALRLHMLACKMCQVYAAQFGAVARVCREAGEHAPDRCPGQLTPERKQRIKDSLR